MYKEDFYHLKKEPFETHPDPGIVFESNTHKEAWYYLLFGIETGEPFLVLTGEYGMGKTLLCLRLMQAVKNKRKSPVEYIPAPNEGYGGILRRVAGGLGISPVPESEAALQEAIYAYFRADTEKNSFYLIIDDAHEMDTALLTKLKQLSTFNHDGFFPIVMFFVAHPSFLQDLKTPALSALSQRIKRRYNLSRLSFEDTRNYISFRLLKSGGTGACLFPEETLQKIYEYSGGIPRLINNICDTSMLIGASRGLISIPPSVVGEARNVIEGSPAGTEIRAGAGVNPYPSDGDAAFIAFPEGLPEGKAAEADNIPLVMIGSEAHRQEKGLRQKSFGKSSKSVAAPALLALFLVTAGGFLYHYFIGDKRMPAESTVEMPRPAYLPVRGPENHVSPDEMTERATFPYSLRASSYLLPDPALQEISEIRRLGLKSYLIRVDLGIRGVWFRTYIGFFSTEEEAKSAQASYNLPRTTVERIDYSCLVGEYSSDAELSTVSGKLEASGYYPYAIQTRNSRYRLYIGAFETKSEAESQKHQLENSGFNCEIVER